MNAAEGWLPYIIVLALIVCFAILLLVRRVLHQRLQNPRIRIGNGQTVGQREEQDDYFATAHNGKATIAALADGISGMDNGRLASTIAVMTMIRGFEKPDSDRDFKSFFERTAIRANREIVHRLGGAQGGTTLVAAVIQNGLLYWASVGDSMIAVIRGGDVMRMNRNQTYSSVLEERFVAGEISKQEVLTHPLKNRLVNYLGHEGFHSIETSKEPFPLEKRDKVILCSDGVYRALTDIELVQLVMGAGSPQKAVEAMIEAVERKGRANQDNATVIILDKGW
ncbi:protein phosphatase 2C domain-containing protein [Marinicrinis lubricantis]|uniref:Protein phosphatase 2C domain-containing protein n=1 Tax=Marinicrinis lubricantis TaxID=2086470 RepID=A0ABW1IND0_9BACL